MSKEPVIFLPGGDKQFDHLKNTIKINSLNILIIGSNTGLLAGLFLEENASSVSIIVDDHDSLVRLRYQMKQNRDYSSKMMEYTKTDFQNSSFDLVFAQASLSNKLRNKIVREIKRVLKPNGYLSVGEITSLKEYLPPFVKNTWEAGNIDPLNSSGINNYYEQRGFEILSSKDLSIHLKEYYNTSKNLLDRIAENFSKEEKSYYKKLLNRISHESNVYLKLGGDMFMGFTSLILRKTD